MYHYLSFEHNNLFKLEDIFLSLPNNFVRVVDAKRNLRCFLCERITMLSRFPLRCIYLWLFGRISEFGRLFNNSQFSICVSNLFIQRWVFHKCLGSSRGAVLNLIFLCRDREKFCSEWICILNKSQMTETISVREKNVWIMNDFFQLKFGLNNYIRKYFFPIFEYINIMADVTFWWTDEFASTGVKLDSFFERAKELLLSNTSK